MTPPAAPRRPWSLRGRLRTTFTVLAAVFLVVAAVAGYASYRFVTSSNDVIYRWQRAASISIRVQDDLVNQETGVRGYELTRRTVSLQPYHEYVDQQAHDIARLRPYLAGESALTRKLTAVERAAATWRRTVALPAIAQVAAGRTGTLAAQLSAKAAFDAFRGRSDELTGALTKRSEAERSTRTTVGAVAVVLAVFGLLVVFASGIMLSRGLGRWVLRPVNRLGAQTREVSSGAPHRQIVPDGPTELIELGHDVEAMRQQIATQLDEAEGVRDELRARGAELARSNEDLQQFAYVASHDLSEPLRKVANFCQLLERQYGPELDDRARQYIHYAVDGAKRMQALITDLLALSRVGRSTESFDLLDLDKKLDLALVTLGERIEQAGARIERLTPLPTLEGDRALIVSLFENLVGNAIKYRRDDVPPVVRISAEREAAEGQWTFTVSDNGIGIDPQYGERIFAVFQRLHLRDRYDGTGIGLALCRRIVEFHGGRIWLADVESSPGATFRFTLPEGVGHRAESRD